MGVTMYLHPENVMEIQRTIEAAHEKRTKDTDNSLVNHKHQI
jgi:hypothetical protein